MTKTTYCGNWDCPYWKDKDFCEGLCTLEDAEEECDEFFEYARVEKKITVGELIDKLKKYDPSAEVNICEFDDYGFTENRIIPEYTRLVWDEKNEPVVEIF